MQGWSPDFIPKITGDAVDGEADRPDPDRCRSDALKASQRARAEGRHLRRHHAGRHVRAALKIAESAPQGATILAMLPDTGERYLSTPLFADVPADMTEDEVKISLSTPFGQLPPKPPAA